MTKKKHIIIGASAVGIAAIHKLRQLDTESDIICISDEVETPYNKCMLADYLAGSKELHHVHTLTPEQAQAKNVTLMLGRRVVRIEPAHNYLVLDDGARLVYDSLLLGMGTRPYMPAVHGVDTAEGIFTFHHMRDIQSIMRYRIEHQAKKVVVIGSGLSGLECADALLAHGMHISVVELKDRVLNTQVDEQGSLHIQNCMASEGVSLYANEKVIKVHAKNNRVHSIELASGKILDADMVVCAVGLVPNLELVQNIGIDHCAQGVFTNEHMQTSISNVYAAGDIAMVHDNLSGQLVPSRTWPDAMLQGLVAAHAMAGQPRPYPGISTIISSSFFGVKFASCGPVINPDSAYQVIINKQPDFYHKYLLHDGNLKGFLLVGNTGNMGKLRQMLMTKAMVKPEELI